MSSKPFSAAGKSFEIHEWRGSGPAKLHVHNSDDEAWHILDGKLTFLQGDRDPAHQQDIYRRFDSELLET